MDTSVLRARMGLKYVEIEEEIHKKEIEIRFWRTEKEAHKRRLTQLIQAFNENISSYKKAKAKVSLGQSQLRVLNEELDKLDDALETINNVEYADW